MSIVWSCVVLLCLVHHIQCRSVIKQNDTLRSPKINHVDISTTRRVPQALAKQHYPMKSQRILVFNKNNKTHGSAKGARRKVVTPRVTTEPNKKTNDKVKTTIRYPRAKVQNEGDLKSRKHDDEDDDDVSMNKKDLLLLSASKEELDNKYDSEKSGTTLHPAYTSNGIETAKFIPRADQLDMYPAKGARIRRLRRKNILCHRHVLIPEGPKYDTNGREYLRSYKVNPKRSFNVTRRPKVVLPACCNCCKKSVLGCE